MLVVVDDPAVEVAAASTVRRYVCVEEFTPSPTRIVNAPELVTVGVPLIIAPPVEIGAKVIPPGSAPDTSVQVNGLVLVAWVENVCE